MDVNRSEKPRYALERSSTAQQLPSRGIFARLKSKDPSSPLCNFPAPLTLLKDELQSLGSPKQVQRSTSNIPPNPRLTTLKRKTMTHISHIGSSRVPSTLMNFPDTDNAPETPRKVQFSQFSPRGLGSPLCRTSSKPETKVYWSSTNLGDDSLFPRNCFQGVLIGNLLYTFGGKDDKMPPLVSLNIETLEVKQHFSPKSVRPRIGHSLIQYKERLVVYGGTFLRKNPRYSVKCLCYDLGSRSWSTEEGYGKVPVARTRHAATQAGRHLLLFGGTLTNSSKSSELFLLDLQQYSWVCPEIVSPGALSHSSLTPILDPALKRNMNYSFFHLSETKCFYSFQNAGVYLFGGLDSRGCASDRLYRLTGSRGVLTWEKIKTVGSGPCARYSHTACSINNFLFVFGGRNDSEEYSELRNGFCDLYILDVIMWNWLPVSVGGKVPRGRWDHCMFEYRGKLMVLGGRLALEALPFELLSLETDKRTIEMCLERDERVREASLAQTIRLTSKFKQRLYALISDPPERDSVVAFE